MTEPKWKKFENLTYEIQKDLAKDATIKQNDFIMGIDSKTNRQIDISIRRNIGQYSLLIVIECKDLKNSIDVEEIEKFVTTVKDIRANKGAVISSSGFTKAAIDLAKTYGIDTFRLINTKSVDWKAYASIPVLLQRHFLKNFRLIFKDFQILPSKFTNSDLRMLKVFTSESKYLGTIHNILAAKWNSEEILHKQGEVEISLGNNLLLEIESQKTNASIIAKIIVGQAFYFGYLPVDLMGFRDEQSGGVVTREITTNKIEPFEIEQGRVKGWQEIDNPVQLAVKPLIVSTYSDVMSEIKSQS